MKIYFLYRTLKILFSGCLLFIIFLITFLGGVFAYFLGFLNLSYPVCHVVWDNLGTEFSLLLVFFNSDALGQNPIEMKLQSRLWAKGGKAKLPLWVRICFQILCFLGICRSHYCDKDENLPRGTRQKKHSERINFYHPDWQNELDVPWGPQCCDFRIKKQLMQTFSFLFFLLGFVPLSSIQAKLQ